MPNKADVNNGYGPTFTTKTKEGRIAIVTLIVVVLALYGTLFAILLINFPWFLPWLLGIFLLGPLLLCVIGFLLYWLYEWIRDGS
jgi:hypothetical protein